MSDRFTLADESKFLFFLSAFSPEHGYGLTYAIDPHKDSLGIIVAYNHETVSQEELKGAMATLAARSNRTSLAKVGIVG